MLSHGGINGVRVALVTDVLDKHAALVYSVHLILDIYVIVS